jgi:hypothetical protein
MKEEAEKTSNTISRSSARQSPHTGIAFPLVVEVSLTTESTYLGSYRHAATGSTSSKFGIAFKRAKIRVYRVNYEAGGSCVKFPASKKGPTSGIFRQV